LAIELRRACQLPIAVVGVGNPMRGDDGFGPAVVASLPPSEGVACFDAGMTPENWLGPIGRASPRTILVLDATDLGEPPGTLRLLHHDAVEALGVSTHGLPLGFFLRMAQQRCGAPALLLAAQPQRVAFGEEMSEAMEAAVQRAAEIIAALAAGDT